MSTYKQRHALRKWKDDCDTCYRRLTHYIERVSERRKRGKNISLSMKYLKKHRREANDLLAAYDKLALKGQHDSDHLYGKLKTARDDAQFIIDGKTPEEGRAEAQAAGQAKAEARAEQQAASQRAMESWNSIRAEAERSGVNDINRLMKWFDLNVDILGRQIAYLAQNPNAYYGVQELTESLLQAVTEGNAILTRGRPAQIPLVQWQSFEEALLRGATLATRAAQIVASMRPSSESVGEGVNWGLVAIIGGAAATLAGVAYWALK